MIFDSLHQPWWPMVYWWPSENIAQNVPGMVSDQLRLQWSFTPLIWKNLPWLMHNELVSPGLDTSSHAWFILDLQDTMIISTCLAFRYISAIHTQSLVFWTQTQAALFPLLNFILWEQTYCYSWLRLFGNLLLSLNTINLSPSFIYGSTMTGMSSISLTNLW